jgi:hypothetical protein
MVPATVTAEELLAAAGSAGAITSFRYEAPSLADLFHDAVQAGPAGSSLSAQVAEPGEGPDEVAAPGGGSPVEAAAPGGAAHV